MINSATNQAILILTNGTSKDILKIYNKLKNAAADFGDVYVLYHTNDNKIPDGLEGVKVETFTDEILGSLNYKPLKNKLVPGSNHFPVLQFYLKHPGYTYYWCIEDDVAFSSNWKNFFENVSPALDYDFITSHIRRYSDLPTWYWWNTLKVPQGEFNNEEKLNSFNPIYRISNKALKYIDACLKNGYSGHHEVLLPSLLRKEGFKIADFGSVDNHVTPKLSYCTLGTMRWKPVFFFPGNKKNKLYHPVKLKVTFKQFLVLIKRTIYNQTEYFT